MCRWPPHRGTSWGCHNPRSSPRGKLEALWIRTWPSARVPDVLRFSEMEVDGTVNGSAPKKLVDHSVTERMKHAAMPKHEAWIKCTTFSEVCIITVVTKCYTFCDTVVFLSPLHTKLTVWSCQSLTTSQHRMARDGIPPSIASDGSATAKASC